MSHSFNPSNPSFTAIPMVLTLQKHMNHDFPAIFPWFSPFSQRFKVSHLGPSWPIPVVPQRSGRQAVRARQVLALQEGFVGIHRQHTAPERQSSYYHCVEIFVCVVDLFYSILYLVYSIQFYSILFTYTYI